MAEGTLLTTSEACPSYLLLCILLWLFPIFTVISDVFFTMREAISYDLQYCLTCSKKFSTS